MWYLQDEIVTQVLWSRANFKSIRASDPSLNHGPDENQLVPYSLPSSSVVFLGSLVLEKASLSCISHNTRQQIPNAYFRIAPGLRK